MYTYIMSDIHGCYSEFLCMMDKIGFSDADRIILAGDYIDRGTQNYEMLKWIEHCPGNVHLIRGNHEEEFAAYVELMCQVDQKEHLNTDAASHEDTLALYETVKYLLRSKGVPPFYFDMYGTISSLLDLASVALGDLCRWTKYIYRMPYYGRWQIRGKNCIVVHAGYAENLVDIGTEYSSLEQFYLYAREESYTLGGVQNAVIVAGHTPTIIKGEFTYNAGRVFSYYDQVRNCTFYDIDCGCAFRGRYADARLACLRLEDEKLFYV